MPLSSNIKPEPNPPLTLVRAVRAREMYAEGFTVARILAHCEMSLGTLYACLDGNPFRDQGEPMPPISRRRQVLGKRHRALKTDAASLVDAVVGARAAAGRARTRRAHADEFDARAARPAGASEDRQDAAGFRT
jgi:hypothetical protein